jgi:RIO kinase 1
MVQKDAFEALEHRIMALRENSRTGDERKTLDEVFDRDTILGIYKLMTDGTRHIQYPISTARREWFARGRGGMLYASDLRTSHAPSTGIARYSMDMRSRTSPLSRKVICLGHQGSGTCKN